MTDYLTCEVCGARKCAICGLLVKEPEHSPSIGISIFHAGECFETAILLQAAYIDHEKRRKSRVGQ